MSTLSISSPVTADSVLVSTQLHPSNKYTPAVKLECIFLCGGPDQMPGNSDTAVYLQTIAIVSQRLKGKLVWVVYATTGGNRRLVTAAVRLSSAVDRRSQAYTPLPGLRTILAWPCGLTSSCPGSLLV